MGIGHPIEHPIDYSLVGLPQLPVGYFWYLQTHMAWGKEYLLPFGFKLSRRRERGVLKIVKGSVSRNSFHTAETLDASRTSARHAWLVRRTARRMARRSVKDGQPVERPYSKPSVRLEDRINPIALYNRTLEAPDEYND